MEETERPLRSLRCERHGLRYDPQIHDGCAVCRRELAGTGSAAAPNARPPGLAAPVVVTLILLVLATAGLTVLHAAVAHRLRTSVPGLAARPSQMPSP